MSHKMVWDRRKVNTLFGKKIKYNTPLPPKKINKETNKNIITINTLVNRSWTKIVVVFAW